MRATIREFLAEMIAAPALDVTPIGSAQDHFIASGEPATVVLTMKVQVAPEQANSEVLEMLSSPGTTIEITPITTPVDLDEILDLANTMLPPGLGWAKADIEAAVEEDEQPEPKPERDPLARFRNLDD